MTDRQGMTTVLLEVSFIGQAAAVKLEVEDLELICSSSMPAHEDIFSFQFTSFGTFSLFS